MKPDLNETINLLQQLIKTESFSGSEDGTADILESFLDSKRINTNRLKNNVWAIHPNYDPARPTVLLNSHHDTVRPNDGWTRNPFDPAMEDDKLYGLGSNDAGGPAVSLISTFLYFCEQKKMPYNLILAITAEEETSGENGISLLLPELGQLDLAIVGEPSGMQMAIAERAAMILDFVVRGKSGHAARDVGINAIDKAVKDIRWFQTYQFPKTSERLGSIKMTVTMIHAGIQHNVIPDMCKFTVDVRVTDAYTNQEVLDIIQKNVQSEVIPRSVQLEASRLPDDHPLMNAAQSLGIEMVASPTSSDQGLISAPSVKIGPGDSNRSHTADEYIKISEIEAGIDRYIRLLEILRFEKVEI